jgi:signal transduction histidine kinase
MLERIFFHDIMNTAGNIKNLSELIIKVEDQLKNIDLVNLLVSVSNELVEEIQEQRQLSEAESGELLVNNTNISTAEILDTIVEQFKSHIKRTIYFAISKDSEDFVFSSDRSLLSRILKNMLKNAMEASSDGDSITIGANISGSMIRFTIHNPNVIPRNIQLQIFKISFSTKGRDRGLGTYSMKLLGERYLKGKVQFKSEEGFGTDFYLDLPLD